MCTREYSTSKRPSITCSAVQKRNIGSMRNSPVHGKGSKVKRAITYDEYPSVHYEQLEPVYQTAPQLDYSELAKYIDQLYYVPSQFQSGDFDSDLHLKKRYLGK